MTLVSIELYLLWCLEFKRNAPVSLITKVSAALPPKPKKKRMLKKLTNIFHPLPPPTPALPTVPPTFARSASLPPHLITEW